LIQQGFLEEAQKRKVEKGGEEFKNLKLIKI